MTGGYKRQAAPAPPWHGIKNARSTAGACRLGRYQSTGRKTAANKNARSRPACFHSAQQKRLDGPGRRGCSPLGSGRARHRDTCMLGTAAARHARARSHARGGMRVRQGERTHGTHARTHAHTHARKCTAGKSKIWEFG
eukprot:IDg20508t1